MRRLGGARRLLGIHRRATTTTTTTTTEHHAADAMTTDAKTVPRRAELRKVKFGNTDMMVTEVCGGTMTWGSFNDEEEDAHAQLDKLWELGVNFLDTAELYPVGWNYGALTEKWMGNWLGASSSARTRASFPAAAAAFVPNFFRPSSETTRRTRHHPFRSPSPSSSPPPSSSSLRETRRGRHRGPKQAVHRDQGQPVDRRRGAPDAQRRARVRRRDRPLVVPEIHRTPQVRSISHWSPYDRVGVVNADP